MADVAVTLREDLRARRLPAALERVRWPLLVIVALSVVWTTWFVLQTVSYFIQPDELEYLQQSARIAEQLHPLLPGDRYFNSWSQLQPLLLAPVWALDDRNLAHQVMGVVNAVVMASAAIPAYLITRRVVAPRWGAYLVALLTVAIPWMAAAATMMTEVAAYPAFLWAVLAVQHAIARPSPKADLLGLAGVALAFSARPQLAVVGPALVGGVLLQELRYATAGDPLLPRRTRVAASLRAAVRRHWVLLAVTLVALLAYAAIRPDVFGGYSDVGVTTGALDAPGLLDFSRETLAYVAVGVGVLPLAMAAGWLLATLWRPLGHEQHAFALVLLITGVALTIAIGSFTARYTPQGINSRYLYYLAPLLFVGMLALATERRALAVPLGLGGLLAGWVVYGSQLAQTGPSLVSPDQTFHTVLLGRTHQVGKTLGLPQLSVPHLAGVLAVVAIVALALLRRGRHARTASLAALAAVTLYCAAETAYSFQRIADTQAGASQEFVDGRRWVDAALPPGAEANVILSTLGDPNSQATFGTWWDVSFWNSQVGQSLTLPTTPDLQQPFPRQFEILPDGTFSGYREADPEVFGTGPWHLMAASDRSFGFRDAAVAAEHFGVLLLKTTTPPRAAWSLFNAFDDTGRILTGWPLDAEILLYPREPAAKEVPVRITLTTLPGSDRGARYVAGPRRGRLRAGETVTLEFRARVGPDGNARVPITSPGKLDQAAPTGLQVVGVEALD